ncbi:hypothetical protein PPL19_12583 [Pseudomonas psychrotolerans L19]|uniref:hypothetical protein n=1 Tax=Pseudomonas TaxID=286 RepID=UPI00023A4C9D|nr:hypothetical protein [Pseudomonas psychrotolerans]EHK70834.1 hypothetical protein PPL19_12583 [Pseudomonas psychrotolerans L19]
MQVIATIKSELPALPIVAEVSYDDATEELLSSDLFCDHAWFLFEMNATSADRAQA